jgi:hypothetical protein
MWQVDTCFFLTEITNRSVHEKEWWDGRSVASSFACKSFQRTYPTCTLAANIKIHVKKIKGRMACHLNAENKLRTWRKRKKTINLLAWIDDACIHQQLIYILILFVGWWYLISRLKNVVGWFVVREKYYFSWKNKLKSTDYKPDEQVRWMTLGDPFWFWRSLSSMDIWISRDLWTIWCILVLCQGFRNHFVNLAWSHAQINASMTCGYRVQEWI